MLTDFDTTMEAVRRLSRSPESSADFGTFIGWIDAQHTKKLHEMAYSSDDANTHRLQGAVAAMHSILSHVQTSVQ